MSKQTARRRLARIVPIVAAVAALFLGASPASAQETDGAFIAEGKAKVREMVNAERAKAGCVPLTTTGSLVRAAAAQSSVQAQRDEVSHRGRHGKSIKARLGGLGFSQVAENVAQYPTAEAAVAGWMGSPRHRANILNCAFTKTGVGVRKSASGKVYWTQTFGG